MLPYEYLSLDRSKNEIRILRFLETNTSSRDPVQCTLQHVSLDALLPAYRTYIQEHQPATTTSAVRGWSKAHRGAQPWKHSGAKPIAIDAWRYAAEYEKLYIVDDGATIDTVDHVFVPSRFDWGDFEAISYCWESDLRDRHVLVDGKVIRITKTLEAMLRELQQLPEVHSGMGFWVDGLCINQADVLEKNHQVKLMCRIYSQSFSTVVWLGISANSSNIAIDSIVESFGDCRVSHVEGREDNWEFHRSTRQLPSGRCWPSILGLCSRQYFKRMWIIQELALNKNMTMFLCGDRRFSRIHLQGVCDSARVNAGKLSQSIALPGVSDGRPVQIKQDFVWGTANNVYNLIKLRTSGKGLDQLLDLVRKAEATDPRDKVYGMLGLLPKDIVAQLQPDYSKAKTEVYIELAISILGRCKRLDELLSWCAFSEESILPSWVPDWEHAHERRHLRRFRECNAGGQDIPRWSLVEQSLGLCTRAVRIGQVNATSVPTRSLLPYKCVDGSKTPETCISPSYGRYTDKGQLLLALERTLVHGHPKRRDGGDLADIPWTDWATKTEHVLERISDSWQYFDRFRQSNASFSIFGVVFKEFFPNINVTCSGLAAYDKRLYWESLIIDCGSNLQSGDNSYTFSETHASNLRRATIAIQHRRLCTTDTGFLGLAPDEVEVGDTVAILLGCNYPVLLRPFEDGFKYVGECYIDGMMEGEAIEAAGHGKYQVEDIVLL